MKLTLGETLQLCSVAIFSLSLSFSIWTFLRQAKQARYSQAARLHEVWWNDDMMGVRDKVYALCRDHARGGPAAALLIGYYGASLEAAEPPGRAAFSKLIGFFSNLEVCMAAGLIDERLATQLFGEAHYADYQPLIAAVREAIGNRPDRNHLLPQWLQITVDLERRFQRQGVRWSAFPKVADTTSARDSVNSA